MDTKIAMEHLIDEKFKEFEEVLRSAFHQMIICGDVTLQINDKKEIEIKNPFKGCNCGETTK